MATRVKTNSEPTAGEKSMCFNYYNQILREQTMCFRCNLILFRICASSIARWRSAALDAMGNEKKERQSSRPTFGCWNLSCVFHQKNSHRKESGMKSCENNETNRSLRRSRELVTSLI